MTNRLSRRDQAQILATVCVGILALAGVCTLLLLTETVSLSRLLRTLTVVNLMSAGAALFYLCARAAAAKLRSRKV